MENEIGSTRDILKIETERESVFPRIRQVLVNMLALNLFYMKKPRRQERNMLRAKLER